MGGFITNQGVIFPSIQITPIVDLNSRVSPRDTGNIGAVGFLNIGNPKNVIVLKRNPLELLTTKVLDGGILENEQAYHIKDFFSKINSKIVMARALGRNSTIESVKLTKTANVFALEKGSPINIWGANNVDDWDDTVKTEALEIVLKVAPKLEVTLSVTNVENIITVTLYDHNSNELYTRTGSTKTDSLDDIGNNNYIGNIVDANILSIKVDDSHTDYEANFDANSSFNDLLKEQGSFTSDNLFDILINKAENCDYFSTLGLYSSIVRDVIKKLSLTKQNMAIFDVKGKTYADALNDKNSIDSGNYRSIFLWERTKSVQKSGVFSIGLSGDFLGRKVSENLSIIKGGVENRNTAIAGVDYPITKQYAKDIEFLSKEDLESLTKNRIITTRDINGIITLSDILSGEPKELAIGQYTTADCGTYLERECARIISHKMFKTINASIRYIENKVKLLLENANNNGFFDTDIELNERFTFEVAQVEGTNDLVEVKLFIYPNNTMRKGRVSLTAKNKFNIGQ